MSTIRFCLSFLTKGSNSQVDLNILFGLEIFILFPEGMIDFTTTAAFGIGATLSSTYNLSATGSGTYEVLTLDDVSITV